MSGELVGYFGYGSLVNRQTLRTQFVASHRASLSGWRRHWQSRGVEHEHHNGRELALLSIEPAQGVAIQGMLVIDRKAHLPEVDKREARYERVPVSRGDIALHDDEAGVELPDELYVYVGHAASEAAQPPVLLQSYLDAVMAGFHAEFGEAGVYHFLETTLGFDRLIVKDRHQPVYPRSVSVGEEMGQWFDALLAGKGVRSFT
ncbi:MAG: gamma-glutamylcyclotransferase family protein [Nitratireductor sp.]